IPSLARVCASITRRVEALGETMALPSLVTMRELESCTCITTSAKYTSGYLRNSAERRLISSDHAAWSKGGGGLALPMCVVGDSLEKSGDLSSSSARTALLVRTFKSAGAARLYSRSVNSHRTRCKAS